MLCRVMVWAASGTPNGENVTVSLACGVTPGRPYPGQGLGAADDHEQVRRRKEWGRESAAHPRVEGEGAPVAGGLLSQGGVVRPEVAVVLLDHPAEQVDVPPGAAGVPV